MNERSFFDFFMRLLQIILRTHFIRHVLELYIQVESTVNEFCFIHRLTDRVDMSNSN